MQIGHVTCSDAVINNSATRCRREFSGVDSTEKKIATHWGKKTMGKMAVWKNGQMHPT